MKSKRVVLSLFEITLIIPEAQAEAMARGELPPDVQNAAISGLIAMRSTPAEFVTRGKRPAKELTTRKRRA